MQILCNLSYKVLNLLLLFYYEKQHMDYVVDEERWEWKKTDFSWKTGKTELNEKQVHKIFGIFNQKKETKRVGARKILIKYFKEKKVNHRKI